jgi:hypothetical protein
MRLVGLILILAGTTTFFVNSCNDNTDDKMLDLRDFKVVRKEQPRVGIWAYGGGIIALAGVAMVVAAGRIRTKSNDD